MFLTIQRYSRDKRGVTLIEVLVVMAIMATLSLVTIGIITSLFDSSIRTSKYLEQNTTIETMYGFMAARLSLTNVGDIGTLTNGGDDINPTSIAGDQFVFTSGSGGLSAGNQLCYRMFYMKDADPPDFPAENSVWVATASDCATIDPTRGPNEVGGPTNDPVLDLGGGNPFVLASDIVPTNAKYTASGAGPNVCNGSDDSEKTFRNTLIPFFFCNSALSTSYNGGDPDVEADSGTIASAGFYGDTDNRSAIRGVQSVSYVDAGEAPTVPVRSYTQLFSLGQVQSNNCALAGSGGEYEVSIPEPQGWQEVGSGTAASFQNSWNNYGGGATFDTAAYYYDSVTRRVHLKGTVSGGNAFTTLFTLPAAYRPDKTLIFSAIGADVNNNVRIDITAAGDVVYIPTTGWDSSYLSLNGISFRVTP